MTDQLSALALDRPQVQGVPDLSLRGPTAVSPAPTRAERPPARPVAPALKAFYLPGAMASIVGLLLLTFVLSVSVLGSMRHARDQRTAYATLRGQLANATAPVAGIDDRGRLLQPGTPVAVLDAPQIGLREVVVEGTSADVLASGPGHRRDTVWPGQAGTSVLMGRQSAYGGPFAALTDLRTGQVITVTTGQGRSAYRVTAVRRAGDPQPAPLAVGKGRLTLVTADGPAYRPTGALRVDADLVTAPFEGAGPAIATSVLPKADVAMASDTAAWILVVLWGQLLLLALAATAWARYRWGRWQTWLVAIPVIGAIGLGLSDELARTLPNLL